MPFVDSHLHFWLLAHPGHEWPTPATLAGWTLADRARDIWVPTGRRGLDPRQLYVGPRLAQRAHVQAPRTAFAFTTTAITIADRKWHFPASLPDQSRIEVEQTGFFTDRRDRVERISGETLWMQQPGWRNNLIGYDTLSRTLAADKGRLFFANSLAFLHEPGQFFIDPESGKHYYKPRVDENMTRLQAVLPRLEMLVSTAGSYDRPVADLDFVGIAFRHTSWLESSSAEGYASQQSGSYLAGWIPDFPSDPIRDCSLGCWAFETRRNRWQQQSAAVQAAAATESRSNRPNLPSWGRSQCESAMIRRQTKAAWANVSQDYKEQAANLVTHAAGTIMTHNDISGFPYDGIDVGWGWGTNDPGGSGAYRSRACGYYDQPGNHVHDTPTILRDTVVAGNRVHRVKTWFADGRAIYHLWKQP